MNSVSDTWSVEEKDFSQYAFDELRDVEWAKKLIWKINRNGGVVTENQGLLFELRFAFNLHLNGINPQYEIPGEGRSGIDFGFRSGSEYWRVELMRLNETHAVRDATHTVETADGTQLTSLHLSTDAKDNRQSSEGETLKAVQRIRQKCEQNGRPHKFPLPDGNYNVILVDFRQFLAGTGDVNDKIHIALGGELVEEESYRLDWDGKSISGVFCSRTKVRGAAEARQRVHFLGFVDEKDFDCSEFAQATEVIANPHLFGAKEDALAALDSWPFRRQATHHNCSGV